MLRATSRAALLALLVAACADADERAARDRAAPADTAADAPSAAVQLYFHRGDTLVAVSRAASGAGAGAALRALLRGPTPAEAAAGLTSWFSAETADRLGSFTVDADGRATVDFDGLAEAIPNASSSAGSTLLLEQLNATLFQDPEIRSIEYRDRGSCEAFWSWLQYDCRVVPRPGGG